MQCLCCDKVVPVDDHCHGMCVNSSNWSGATGLVVACGYGSRFDTATFHGVICDDCIEARKSRMVEVASVISLPPHVTYTNGGERDKTSRRFAKMLHAYGAELLRRVDMWKDLEKEDDAEQPA